MLTFRYEFSKYLFIKACEQAFNNKKLLLLYYKHTLWCIGLTGGLHPPNNKKELCLISLKPRRNYIFIKYATTDTMPLISPSLLSADFGNLQHDLEMLNQSECDWYHLDVMDGVFVPNISFGFPVMQAMAKHATKPLDVHLMIEHPEKFLKEVKALGAKVMNVHYEACTHLHRVVQQIKAEGMMAGVTLNPHTPVSALEEIICDLDLVMLMSVNPGFGGQKFIEHTIDKTIRLRQLIERSGSKALIEIDGGVNRETGKRLVEAGADVLVAGSAVFKAADPVEEVHILKHL